MDEQKKETKDILIELRESTGMTRRQFCDYFGIPYRTLQDWELGNRKMPDYLLRLMTYKINVENIVKQ
jgi:DNA-binding transcriptional regulator YiaG